MDYEALEQEIVSRLQSDTGLTDICNIVKLPDDIAEYRTPVAKGLITVVFLGEKADPNQSVGDLSHHTTLTFNLSIQSRLLRGARGVYAISEQVKRLLLGFRLSHSGRMNLVEQEFSDYQNDIWEHSLTMSCRSLRTQEDREIIHTDDVTQGDYVYYQKHSTDENIHV